MRLRGQLSTKFLATGVMLLVAAVDVELLSLAYDPLRRKAWVGGPTAVNYLACAVKS